MLVISVLDFKVYFEEVSSLCFHGFFSFVRPFRAHLKVTVHVFTLVKDLLVTSVSIYYFYKGNTMVNLLCFKISFIFYVIHARVTPLYTHFFQLKPDSSALNPKQPTKSKKKKLYILLIESKSKIYLHVIMY